MNMILDCKISKEMWNKVEDWIHDIGVVEYKYK